MRTLVIGDIHGAYKALLQCVERSGFNKYEDQLICLGDVADGWPEVREVFEYLLTISNLIYIIGNHDKWLLDWFNYSEVPSLWLDQGGKNSIKSYLTFRDDFDKQFNVGFFEHIHYPTALPQKVPSTHISLLENAHLYYVDNKNRLFVHGGIDINQKDMSKQKEDTLMWDRELVSRAIECYVSGNYIKLKKVKEQFSEVLVGHTTTSIYNSLEPLKYGPVRMLDTGAGWEGKLTIMDVDTKEYWQSDLVLDLYPGERGRR